MSLLRRKALQKAFREVRVNKHGKSLATDRSALAKRLVGYRKTHDHKFARDAAIHTGALRRSWNRPKQS